jgi:hypothetical protein
MYQRGGEELLSGATKDEKLRGSVVGILTDCLLPLRLEQVETALRAGREDDALALIAPAESFYLAAEYRRRHASEKSSWGPAGNELEEVLAHLPT